MPDKQSHSAQLVIQNKKGLHARAAAKFVQTAKQYNASVTVQKLLDADGSKAGDDSEYTKVSGSSILGLMMLAAEQGSTIEVAAQGNDAKEAITTITTLINSKFEEAE